MRRNERWKALSVVQQVKTILVSFEKHSRTSLLCNKDMFMQFYQKRNGDIFMPIFFPSFTLKRSISSEIWALIDICNQIGKTIMINLKWKSCNTLRTLTGPPEGVWKELNLQVQANEDEMKDSEEKHEKRCDFYLKTYYLENLKEICMIITWVINWKMKANNKLYYEAKLPLSCTTTFEADT